MTDLRFPATSAGGMVGRGPWHPCRSAAWSVKECYRRSQVSRSNKELALPTEAVACFQVTSWGEVHESGHYFCYFSLTEFGEHRQGEDPLDGLFSDGH
jgi:hypothetical protein